MLNESLRIMKGTIREIIQDQKEKKVLEKRQQQYVKDIVRGEFPKLFIKEDKTAEIIVRWCGNEENPVQFFLKQLAVVGIKEPVQIANIVEGKDYNSFVLKENSSQRIWSLHLSKYPKEYLIKEIVIDEKVYYAVKKIPYEILDGNDYDEVLRVEKSNIKLRYCKQEKIKISIGGKIEIELDDIDWQNKEKLELYPKAINLLEELREMDQELEFYDYYTEIKKKLNNYYQLENVGITFSMKNFSISTRDGKIVDYEDRIKGVIIKNYNNWTYKEYCIGKQKVVLESDKIKIEGVKVNKSQEIIETAEKAIKEVESLEY